MAHSNPSTPEWTSARAERPWLLATNRKLRNLLAISLRNITLVSTASARRHVKTIDDDALPQTLKSPAKLFALSEQKALGHSRSSTDLRAAAAEDAVIQSSVVEEVDASHSVATRQGYRSQSTTSTGNPRPNFEKIRRRSTLEWANATPQRRQEKLEDATDEHMVDVFFSLHAVGIKEPLYISEVVEQTMNPTFRHIDWSGCKPGIMRKDDLTLNVYVKRGKEGHWKQLLHLMLELPALQYLGNNLDAMYQTLPENAVLCHLADGVYAAYTGSINDYAPNHSDSSRKPLAGSRPLPTSSFDALLRLAKLDDSIQDGLATRDQIAGELDSLLDASKEALVRRDELAEAEDRIKTINFAKHTVEKQLEKAYKHQEDKRRSIAIRRKLMRSGALSRDDGKQFLQNVKPEITNMQEEHRVKTKAIENQRRRVCDDLQNCYPIQQISGRILSFSIRDLHLPNADDLLDSETPEVVAAAMGHVTQAVQLLAFYLSHPLPYPVTPRGSTSSIYDPISVLKTNTSVSSEKAEMTLRTYPLFSKAVPRFRFEYAVFLLNQDIRVLLENVFNLRVLDPRQTLPNLKYLFYVATAGEGELPARKAGGVKGLMRAPVMQRLGSTDSSSSALSGLTLLSNGKPKGAAERLKDISAKAF